MQLVNQTQLYLSKDGVNWALSSTSLPYGSCQSIATDGTGTWILLVRGKGPLDDDFIVKTDNIEDGPFTEVSPQLFGSDLAYLGGNSWICVGLTNQRSTDNGLNWVLDASLNNAASVANARCITVAYESGTNTIIVLAEKESKSAEQNLCLTSTDGGSNWVEITIPIDGTLIPGKIRDVATDGFGTWVGLQSSTDGGTDSMVYSKDSGMTWSIIAGTELDTSYLKLAVDKFGRWVAVTVPDGASMYVRLSSDGITWTDPSFVGLGTGRQVVSSSLLPL